MNGFPPDAFSLNGFDLDAFIAATQAEDLGPGYRDVTSEAVIPAVRKAHKAGIPVIVTNSNIAEEGFDFVASFSGPDNITQGSRSAEIMCDKFKEMGIEDEARVVQISGQPGYTPAIERQRRKKHALRQ